MYYLYKLGKETREDFNYKKKSREKKNLVILFHSVVWQHISQLKRRQACTADRSKHTVWKTLLRICPR